MSIVSYWTPSVLPIEAFTVMGMSAKPNSKNPIGEFGTGLKLAVAATLRLGGEFRMFIENVEYVFYVKKRNFRGTEHDQVMLRKRKGGMLAKWSYQELPFTLNYGRNLSWWQIHRELESNTRDEDGEVAVGPAEILKGGTTIQVEHPEIVEAAIDGNVFFDPEEKPIWSADQFDVYDRPSEHLYYRGVRIFTMEYPSKFTYNFKHGHVRLTEDRSPSNVWWLNVLIRTGWMTTRSIPKETIERALKYNAKVDSPSFETHSLEYDASLPGISASFLEVARALKKSGFMSEKFGGFYGSWTTIQEKKATAASRYKRVRVTFEEAELIAQMLRDRGMGILANKFSDAEEDTDSSSEETEVEEIPIPMDPLVLTAVDTDDDIPF